MLQSVIWKLQLIVIINFGLIIQKYSFVTNSFFIYFGDVFWLVKFAMFQFFFMKCEWKDFIIHLFFLVVVFLKCCPVVHSQEDTKAVGNSYAVFRHVERPAKMHTNTNTQTKRQLKKQNITAVIGNFGNLADEVSPTPSLYVCLFMLE